MHAVTWLTISGAFVLGVALSFMGSIKLELGRRLQIGETRTGALLSILQFTLIPLMLLSGLLLDRLGIKVMIFAGSVLTWFAIYTFTASTQFRTTTMAVVLLGMGIACLSPATIVLMPQAFFPDQLGASLERETDTFFVETKL